MRSLFSGFIASDVGSPILAAFALSYRLDDIIFDGWALNH